MLTGQQFTGATSHVADMRRLSPGRTFDGLLAWDSFFHLCQDNQRLMFPIFRAFASGPARADAIGR